MRQSRTSRESSDIHGNDAVRPGKHDENQASFADRVGASASGLIQNSWSHTAPDTVTDSLAAIHASATKGEPSNSFVQRDVDSATNASRVTQSQGSISHGSGFGESFRTRSLNDRHHFQDEFNQWSTPVANGDPENAFAGYDLAQISERQPATQSGEPSANPRADGTRNEHNEKADLNDGAAVVSLLSNPAFDINDLPLNVWDYDPPAGASQVSQADHTLLKHSINTKMLSKGQRKSFRMQNPSVQQRSIDVYTGNKMIHQSETLEKREISSKDRQREGSLRLIPKFGVPEEISIKNSMGVSQWDELKARLSNGSEGDVGPWLQILDRYHDEVWGTMLPLIQRAREEVRSGKENTNSGVQVLKDGSAVRRLKLVLQHLDHPT